MREIWDIAVAAAGDIFSEIIGELLGWVIVLAVLAVPLLVIYFVLKKLGYGHVVRIGFRKAPPGFGLDLLDGRVSVEPVEPPAIDAPPWQKEMMETWEKEGQVKRRAAARGLQERKRYALRFYRWLVYGTVGALVAGAAFFWLQAMRGQAMMWVAGLVLAGGAAVAYAKLDPAQFD